MKKFIQFFKNSASAPKTPAPSLKREELEKKAVEGAKKAIKEYRQVFERLAEYDRT